MRQLGVCSYRSSCGVACVLAVFLAASGGLAAGPYAADRVEDLRQVLKRSIADPSNKQELDLRAAEIGKRLEAIRTISDMRRALALQQPGWRDVEADSAIGAIDRSLREGLAKRLHEALRERLDQGDTITRQAAATVIGEMGVSIRAPGSSGVYAREYAPDLAKLAESSNEPAVVAALRALGKINPEPAVAAKALSGRLTKGTLAERRAAAEATIDMIQVVAPLARRVSGPQVGEVAIDRQELFRASQAVVPVAQQGLNDPDAQVRRRCLEAIQLAAEVLVDNIERPDLARELPSPDRKQEQELQPLTKALGDAAPAVAGALQAREPEVRLQAARALEEISEALDKLRARAAGVSGAAAEKAAAEGPARLVAAKAAWFFLVQKRAGEKSADPFTRSMLTALPALEAALSDADVRLRLSAIAAIENYGPEAAAARKGVIKALRDPDRFVRWAAVRIVGDLGPDAAGIAVAGLARLLEDADVDLRIAAARSLERYGQAADAAVPALIRAAGRGDAEPRVAAIHALEAIGKAAEVAIPALTRAVSTEEPHVRQAAAAALGRFGAAARSAVPALRQALEDDDAEVRSAAADALVDILPSPKGR